MQNLENSLATASLFAFVMSTLNWNTMDIERLLELKPKKNVFVKLNSTLEEIALDYRILISTLR